MKLLRRILLVIVVTVLIFSFAGIAATWAPDRSVAELAPRWAQAPSRFIFINGMQVHIRDEGRRDDPEPLVLLHGTSASLHTWDAWVEVLKLERRIIRFDLPGFGLTGPHPTHDYSLEAYVSLVEAVTNTLSVKSFSLAGNSLGGQIAWAAAHAMPQRVSRLILVDAAGYPSAPQSIPIGFKIAQMPGLRKLAEVVLPRGVVESSLRNVYGDPGKVSSALIDRYYELTLREGNRQALAYRVDQMQKVDPVKSVSAIQSLKLPTLIIWGGKDRLIPVENAYRFATDVVGSKLVIFDALGHVPQEEDATATMQVVQNFLDKPL